MQPVLKPFEISDHNQKLSSEKVTYGMYYGISAGLAFAFAAWGIDGYQLSQAHALFPWLKFILGAIICTGLGGLAGRIAAAIEKVFVAILIWLVTSAIFAWLSVGLPFQIVPSLTVLLRPDLKNLLNYTYYPDFQYRLSIALIWAVLLGFFIGLLQLVLTESAVYSISFLGKSAPLLVCIIFMAIAGIWIDNLNNQPLRDGLLSINAAIQYLQQHHGQVIPPQIAQEQHLYALSSVEDLIDRPRSLFISNYSSTLEDIHVIVNFGGTLVDCESASGQPLFCKPVVP